MGITSKIEIMKYFVAIFVSALLMSFGVFAQVNNFTKHTVLKGETIKDIATKYKVTPFDIYRLNPDSQTGVKESDVILIPTSTVKEAPVSVVATKPKSTSGNQKLHVSKPKETLYSISKEYNVTVEDLKKSNAAILKEGLKTGQTLVIPNATVVAIVEPKVAKSVPVLAKKVEEKSATPKTDKVVYHVVEPKETKFGIAKKYGITVQELEQKNPEIVANLTIGYKLIISGSDSKLEEGKPKIAKPEIQKTKAVVKEVVKEEVLKIEPTKKAKVTGFENHEVKPKETLYSLCQTFGVSKEELITLNPALIDGVKIGMILKVPSKNAAPITVPVVNVSSSKFPDLTKTLKKSDKKLLALLIPFNASKIQGDTLNSIAVRLKKDSFLNMTLDFYSGALMAIDSAKTLGLNVDVKIFDSEETKLFSNVPTIISSNNLQEADAIIGPFYQQYVEKAAEILGDKNVPIISPLSKEMGKSYSNLYQAMPSNETAKNAMIDFMLAKNGNIIVVSDLKKLSKREFFIKKNPDTKFAALTETGELNVDNLKSLLAKDKLNYIVLDSHKTGIILAATNALLTQMSNFQIQLAIVEPNETLDFEEISMKRLTILKMLYPSLTRESNTPSALAFGNQYKSKNKIFPSQFAIRGFDITLDTMLRLSQGKTFEASVNQDKTEQVESKFDYAKKPTGGYVNKGIYIMEYQDDLSVKQVN